MNRTIETPAAPAAIGPYAQAVLRDGWLWCSGQIPLDPETGEIVGADVATQTHRVLENLTAVLVAAGGSLADVVKTTVYLADLEEFGAMNGVYAEVFGDHRPARATVEVARLPRDVRVEIDCIACVPR